MNLFLIWLHVRFAYCGFINQISLSFPRAPIGQFRWEAMKLSKPSPALALFLLSPAIGELLSGSAPPLEFFNPLGFVMIVSLYGSGAIIVRELKIRWKKGIGSLLLLGSAYGILEEGLLVCSFFNPDWPDLGQLALYGRWLGINWVWATMLTIYHAIYSIIIPVVLVELAYPQRRHESWVSNRTFKTLLTLLASVVALGFVLFASLSNYVPPLAQYLITVLAMTLFGYAAYKFPAKWESRGEKPLSSLFRIWIIGASGTFAFFFGFWLIPSLIPLWPIGMFFGPALILLYTKVLKRYEWRGSNKKYSFALVSGALTFFIIFAPLQELDSTRTDNPVGMSLVGLTFLVGLILLGRRIWTTSNEDLYV